MEKAIIKYQSGENLQAALDTTYDKPTTIKQFLSRKSALNEIPKAIEVRQAGQRYLVERDRPTKYIDTLAFNMSEAKQQRQNRQRIQVLKGFHGYLNDPVPDMVNR
jgi:hypothetical protein